MDISRLRVKGTNTNLFSKGHCNWNFQHVNIVFRPKGFHQFDIIKLVTILINKPKARTSWLPLPISLTDMHMKLHSFSILKNNKTILMLISIIILYGSILLVLYSNILLGLNVDFEFEWFSVRF